MSIPLDWRGAPNEQALLSQTIAALFAWAVGSTRIAAEIMGPSYSWPQKRLEREWCKINNPVIVDTLFWSEDSCHELGWGQTTTCRFRRYGVYHSKVLSARSKVSKVTFAGSFGGRGGPRAPWGSRLPEVQEKGRDCKEGGWQSLKNGMCLEVVSSGWDHGFWVGFIGWVQILAFWIWTLELWARGLTWFSPVPSSW